MRRLFEQPSAGAWKIVGKSSLSGSDAHDTEATNKTVVARSAAGPLSPGECTSKGTDAAGAPAACECRSEWGASLATARTSPSPRWIGRRDSWIGSTQQAPL